MQSVITVCVAAGMMLVDTLFIIKKNNNKKYIFILLSAIIIGLCCTVCVLKGTSSVYASFLVVLTGVLNIITVFDIKTKFIPSILLIVLNILGFAAMFFVAESLFIKNLIGAWTIVGLCFLLGRKVKGGIGSGDLLCMGALMMSTDFSGMMNFMFASLFSSMIFGIICLITKKHTLKSEIPFAPFMLIGYMSTIIFS